VCGALGLVSRIVVALLSTGTNDALTWHSYAASIDRVGVRFMYEHVPLFNHPPLMGYLAAASLRSAQDLGLPFALSFKLPMILADVLTTVLLWKIVKARWGPVLAGWAVVAFDWSGVAILVSGFHANTDNLCAALCLLSAYSSEQKRPLVGGLALAAALNVKLIPIVLIPAFVLRARTWHELLYFTAGLTVGVLPFVPFLVCCGPSFYRNAIAYNSDVQPWGLMLFLLHSDAYPAFRPLTQPLRAFYVAQGRVLIMGVIVVLSGWAHVRDRWNRYELGAMCFAIFLILTPGFGVQYTVYIVPLLCAVSVRWATLYSIVAGMFISLVYYTFWTGTLPVYSFFNTTFPMPTPVVGFVAWAVLVCFLVWCLCRRTGDSTERGAP
jgi:hypothetical protein